MRCPTKAELPPPPASKTGWPWTIESPQMPDRMPDGSQWPRISIVTPSYNQGLFLEEAIRSVLLQGYPNLEYIIMDGGSTDDSVDVIRRYAGQLAHWRSERDGGQSQAIKIGFARASGKIINWLNSDDMLCAGALHKVALRFRNSGIVAVYGNRKQIDSHSQVLEEIFPPLHLTRGMWLLGQPIPQEATFVSKEAYERVGGIDDTLFFCMDYSLYVRLFAIGKFRKVRSFVGAIRIHVDTKSSNFDSTMWKEFHAINAKRGSRKLGSFEEGVLRYFGSTQSRAERLLRHL